MFYLFEFSGIGFNRGNVIFFILIFIVLFAALSYAVSQSMRDGNVGTTTSQKLELDLAQIQSYANTLRTTARALMVDGCTDEQLNFASTRWSNVDSMQWGYLNAVAPGDKHCDIFDAAGGSVTFQRPPLSQLAPKLTGAWQDYVVTGGYGVKGLGLDTCPKTELIMFTQVSRDMCLLANEKLGIPKTGSNPPQATYGLGSTLNWAVAFGWGIAHGNTSNYGCGMGVGYTGTDSQLMGRSSGCFQGTDTGLYVYYEVLLPR